ncbi:allophanate hydrolase [Streptomyces spinoverrucosus]|uniref:Allophanate hydrolase n=1 Tax=Streptomyces spinoverrucosus TaxID=284043 RepID=A0A4Y3VTC0_9ACTN|nr:allophanate hydrolase [Streptomyces spinoverrucosus]GHB95286.1 allophanate hydrolase [Streptomyces spinoverrucosus]
MRVLPVGDSALLVEVSSGDEAQALHAELLRRRAEGSIAVREIVPAARTVLLDGLTDPVRLASELTSADVPTAPPRAGEVVELPVRYDGPDLADVAALWGVTEREVARIHAGTEFRVAFCGFAPGFGYLTGLPPHYDVPRRATPRTSVPAGSVALAGPYTGVYPHVSPGGWQLIGSTDTVLWDHARVPAALLSPGTRVRFVPVGTYGPGPVDANDRGPVDADRPDKAGTDGRGPMDADRPDTAGTDRRGPVGADGRSPVGADGRGPVGRT